MVVFVALLFTMLIIYIVIISVKYKEIEKITTRLKDINNTDTNTKILLSSRDKKLEGLAAEINRTIDKQKETEIKYKKMELELRQAIGNISHDLRTPLTSITGYLELIEDNHISQEERSQYIDIVRKRANSLQALITSFYDMSRLEAKEYKFNLIQINITNIIQDILVSFYNDFLAKNIEPVIELHEKPYFIIGDESSVRRVISNLIQNILRYGGKKAHIYLRPEEGFITTIFKNDAPGLKPEDTAHLFERFFTGDKTRTGKSTGLGLSITKQLVEKMGHRIHAEFSEGELSIIIEWKIA